MTRTRVIDLAPHSETGPELVLGMLIKILRCETSDTIYAEVLVGDFTLVMWGDDYHLKTRKAAVERAREFVRAIGYTGMVRWQLGNGGAICDEPKL